jgi:2-methylcitrate dehydratase PrpD
LTALLIGYEVGSRLGGAARLRSDMHPHGTWGTVGAAAAVARLAGCDARAMREVLNVSSSLTLATSKRTMLEGGTVRNTYAGVSNQIGLFAVDLVDSGFTGERDGLASVFGRVVSESLDTEALARRLGEDWQVMQNYFKRHGCCRYNHGTLDALLAALAEKPQLRAEEVASVDVETYGYAAELDDQSPQNTLAAKFSVPFAVATTIVNGSSRMASFTMEAVRDERVQALAKRVAVREDPALSAMLPMYRPARVTVRLADGRALAAEVRTNRGDDADPYSRTELDEKFFELTERIWPHALAARLHDALHSVERLGDLRGLTQMLLTPARP